MSDPLIRAVRCFRWSSVQCGAYLKKRGLTFTITSEGSGNSLNVMLTLVSMEDTRTNRGGDHSFAHATRAVGTQRV